jgi:hypothetical protein
MYLTAPRRHSSRTLAQLLRFFTIAGLLGALVAALLAAFFAALQVPATPERFAISFFAVAPAGIVGILCLWHFYMRPRINFDRQVAFDKFEALKRRYGIK